MIYGYLLESLPSPTDQARLLAIRTKEYGLWLSTVPSANIGTLMDNMIFKISVNLRVCAKFYFPHECICGVNLDPHGYNGLNTGRFSRHFQHIDVILVSAGFRSFRELVGISRTDVKNQDGLTLLPWSRDNPYFGMPHALIIWPCPIYIKHQKLPVPLQFPRLTTSTKNEI
ncbi:hypothetical protein C0J52_24333 [Blattella germanica]|nr:hypothetical protein C0J52_24333 [Blattella germanica]